jgi:ribosomal-protein-alanine N-acetyltransferase
LALESSPSFAGGGGEENCDALIQIVDEYILPAVGYYSTIILGGKSVNEFPILDTRRLILREFQPIDAQAVFESLSQEATTRYINRGPMQSLQEAQELVKIRGSLFERGFGIRWAIALREKTDYVIGSSGFYKLDKGNRSVEIGYDLHPDYWRQGIITEVLKTVIDFAYSDDFFVPLNRIQALTYLDHAASIGLLKKLGFQEEGIRREAGYWKDQYHDLRSFSLLRRDWITGE